MTEMLERATLFSEPGHTEVLGELRELLEAGEPLPAQLPVEINNALRFVVEIMHDSGAVVIAALPEELSTGEAAELLGVSRPTLVKLAEEGEIEYSRPSVHRRVSRESVLAYRERRRAARRAGIEAMLRDVEDYDTSTDDIPMKYVR